MTPKHICIIGAGPGALTAAMILSYRGYRVSVFEMENQPGGRNRTLNLGPYVFDTGPTFQFSRRFLPSLGEMLRST